jgi:hypothetical protein
MHFALDEDTIWSWDADSGVWQQFSGAGSIPDATSAAGGAGKGKITIDENYALYASSGILRMALNSLGALQFNAGTPNTLGVKVEATTPTLAINVSNELGVKYDVLNGLNTSSLGLVVKVDGSTVSFDPSGNLQAVGSPEAKRIENTINVDAAVLLGNPVYLTATGNRVAPADTDTDAKSRVIGIARTAQPAIGSGVEVVEVGRCDGVLSLAVPGTPYYLATGGGLSTAAPTGAGKRVIQIGVAINASDLMVRVIDFGKKA